ncbi:MAG: ComEC family competence protein, partial [Planctomycetia bacterium]|nr:ComEC family competence protein [Planctomycetia bacterium]
MGAVIERVEPSVAGRRPSLTRARDVARRAWRREPLPTRPLVVVAAVLAIGCGLPAVAPAPAVAWWLAAVAWLAAWCGLTGRGRPRAAAVALCLAIACSGAAWSVARGRLFDSADLAWGLAETPVPVAIEGIVMESARPLPAAGGPRGPAQTPSSECLVDVRAVRDGDRWRPAGGRAAVIVDGEPPSLVAGSRVRIVGRGVRPAGPLNPGEFDFRERSRAVRCLSIVRCHSAECIALLAGPHPLSPTAAIDRLRTAGMTVLRRYLSPASAPLASALLLGGRESLPREDSRAFLVTGTIHILSISGLHVGLLALALFRSLRTLSVPRGWSLVAVAVCTGLYMLLVRAETPVVRATLLVWLSCLAAAVGRRSPALNGLAAAAVVVLAWHPPELFRIGTQLSFLSTAVLVAVASTLAARRSIDDPIERLIDRSRPPLERWLRHRV